MLGRVLEYLIRAKDKTKEPTSSAAGNFEALRAKASHSIAGLIAKVGALAGAMIGIRKVGGLFVESIKVAFQFERYETQFKVLLGSLEAAKARMAELAEFSAKTPFQLGEIAQASRQLHVFSGGVLGAADSLKLVGDAAATSGKSIDEVAFWVGRAYSAIQAGLPFGEAGMRLQEMAILSGDARNKMDELTAAGATNAEIWAVLQGELEKFNGGMEELSKTGEGLVSTLKDNWKLALGEFGKAFTDIAKNDIKGLSDALSRLKEDGTIAVWADRAVEALRKVRDAIGPVARGIGSFLGHIRRGAAYLGARSIGLSKADAWGATEESERQRTEARGKREAAVRTAAQSRQTEAKATEEKTLNERIAEAMAISQKATDEKHAKEKAEAEAKAQEKADKERAAQLKHDMEELVRAEKDARSKMQQDLQAELAASNTMAGDQRSRLERAKSQVAQAWGWYRDPESFKAQLAEESAEKSAQAQFVKDEARLKRRSEWRTRKLDAPEEAVRRVVLAREEEQAAARNLALIEEHTRGLAEQLRVALAMKG